MLQDIKIQLLVINKLAPLVDKQLNMKVDAYVTDHLSHSTVSYIWSHSSSVTKFKIWYVLANFLCNRIRSQASYLHTQSTLLHYQAACRQNDITQWHFQTYCISIMVTFSYIYSDSQQMRDNVYAVHILWRAPVYIVEFRNFSTFFLFLSLWKCETNKQKKYNK